MINAWLKFDSFYSLAATLIIFFIVATVFVGIELKRKVRFYPFRIVATLTMLLSLILILIKPSIQKETSDSAILLTENYSQSKTDSLKDIYPELKIIRTTSTKPYRNDDEIFDIHQLANLQAQVKFIMGEGLADYNLRLLPDNRYYFLPADLPSGIISIQLTPSAANKRTEITGLLRNSNNTTIKLNGPSGTLDSINIGDKNSFHLTFTPKEAGIYTYKLMLQDSLKIQYEYDLPIEVKPDAHLNILFIQNFPTFENQYLKSFLGRRHEILLRNKLSINTFRYEYINRKPETIARLTENNLSNFDLLLIDTDALRDLSSAEKSALQSAIQNGLGMILLFNDDPAKLNFKNFADLIFSNYKSDTAKIAIDSRTVTVKTWNTKLGNNPATATLTKNKNRVLSGYQHNGFGKIGFHLWQETYSLLLAGDSIAYSKLWTNLTEATSRVHQPDIFVEPQTNFPVYPNEPYYFSLITDQLEPIVKYQGTRIPLREDLHIDNLWHGNVWAERSGWQSLELSDSTKFNFFVSEPDAWTSLRKANNRAATLASQRKRNAQTALDKYRLWEPVSPLIFYLIFLISAGVLWLTPKL